MQFINENQSSSEVEVFPNNKDQNSSENSDTFKESTIKLMEEVFDANNDEKTITNADLSEGLTKFFEVNGDDIARIDIAGIPLYIADDLPGLLEDMINGDSYSHEIGK